MMDFYFALITLKRKVRPRSIREKSNETLFCPVTSPDSNLKKKFPLPYNIF
jgi:hypothetical protein